MSVLKKKNIARILEYGGNREIQDFRKWTYCYYSHLGAKLISRLFDNSSSHNAYADGVLIAVHIVKPE